MCRENAKLDRQMVMIQHRQAVAVDVRDVRKAEAMRIGNLPLLGRKTDNCKTRVADVKRGGKNVYGKV